MGQRRFIDSQITVSVQPKRLFDARFRLCLTATTCCCTDTSL